MLNWMNEDFVFHGATPETIENICKGGFDSRDCCIRKLGSHTNMRTHFRMYEVIAQQDSSWTAPSFVCSVKQTGRRVPNIFGGLKCVLDNHDSSMIQSPNYLTFPSHHYYYFDFVIRIRFYDTMIVCPCFFDWLSFFREPLVCCQKSLHSLFSIAVFSLIGYAMFECQLFLQRTYFYTAVSNRTLLLT